MKKIIIAIVLLLFTTLPVLADGLYNSEILLINLNISSDMDIVPLSSNYGIDYVIVNLSFYPYENYRQDILQIDIVPEAEIADNTIEFRWDNPSEAKLGFNVNSVIRTHNKQQEVKNKVKFPLTDIPAELVQYTKPSETIDSDDNEIIALASELAHGEDDLFIVVSSVGEWVKNNVNYDLSTLTADVSQKASWVLKSEYGVCDEITNLFIALLRALGIPAKFISGIAYTNAPEAPSEWGLHGWAEVYFPEYGWVAFDVTYGEFGFIDATHIKLKEALDANEPSTHYQWLGSNVNLNTRKLSVDSSVKEQIGESKPLFAIDVKAINDYAGFGSYNLIEVALENLNDYYAATELFISRPLEIGLVDGKTKVVYLKPKEKKNIYWPVKISSLLKRNFMYTLPIEVSTSGNTSASALLFSTSESPSYSLKQITDIINEKQEEAEKTYSRNVDLNCSISRSEFYEYEDNLLDCSIKNTGNVFLKNVGVCLEDSCINADLGISQEKRLNFSVVYDNIGKQELIVSAKNNQISKAVHIKIDVLDKPQLGIINITYPEAVSYNDEYEISFTLSKKSASSPADIDIVLDQDGFKKEWTLSQLTGDKRFVINLYGKDLDIKENGFKVSITYKDKNGRVYKEEKEFFIDLTNVSFFQRIAIFFKGIGKFVMRPFL